MGERILNSFISAIFGGLAATATVWYLGAPGSNTPAPDDVENAERLESADDAPRHGKFDELETARLKVTDCVMVCDTETGEPMIELRAGSILAKKKIVADSFGGNLITGRKMQITPGDPSRDDSPIFSELATNEEGGAYFALLSPKGTHSVNMGFDKKETGFIISQNNQDSAMVAQAILPLPNKNDRPDELLSQETDNKLNSNTPGSTPNGAFPLPSAGTPPPAMIPASNPENAVSQALVPIGPASGGAPGASNLSPLGPSVPQAGQAEQPRQGVSITENGPGTPRGLF